MTSYCKALPRPLGTSPLSRRDLLRLYPLVDEWRSQPDGYF
jgi:hypothetical protein